MINALFKFFWLLIFSIVILFTDTAFGELYYLGLDNFFYKLLNGRFANANPVGGYRYTYFTYLSVILLVSALSPIGAYAWWRKKNVFVQTALITIAILVFAFVCMFLNKVTNLFLFKAVYQNVFFFLKSPLLLISLTLYGFFKK